MAVTGPGPTCMDDARSHVDPICGMTVGDDSPRRFAFDGKTYYFCSDHCLRKFSADPARYVAPSKRRAEPEAAPGTIYTLSLIHI